MKKKPTNFLNENDLILFEEMHIEKEKDWYTNQFHLSSFSGLINDPNGLIKVNDIYYIFMQNVPYSSEHKKKSWCLYTTKNFIDYKYEGIVVTPSCKFDQDGTFSGSAEYNNGFEIFYTGNVKIGNKKRTAYTINAKIDFLNKRTIKKILFEEDLTKYSGHFRDPIIIRKGINKFMLNGAQTKDNNGVISIYKFIKDKWLFIRNEELNLKEELPNYMLECPNYLNYNGYEAIIFCAERYHSLNDGGHFVYYKTLTIDEHFNLSNLSNLSKLDYGFDFYAPQIFQNSNKKMLMGWLGNSASNLKHSKVWNYQLTIPREIFIANNKIYQNPIEELEQLRVREIKNNHYNNGLFEIIANNILDNFEIIIKNPQTKKIIISYSNNIFKIDRSNCDYNDINNLPPVIKKKI
ncbi:hypothetical protein [Spiroplasma sp. SV19]|uniref:hypothetical protein n=1 Tax=Spiroplasma sp. SV19 TaxID=2570468 RepID=UPI0024B701BC|nr:hypothetical protein [Spiroplasma sp. SV19]